MALCIGGLEPRGLYPSVDLGRRDGSVPEKLLDRTQVGPALEQVRRERMAQRMRVRRRPAPRRDASRRAGGAARRTSTAAARTSRGTARGVVVAVLERRAGALEVARDRAQRRLADRHEAGLRPLALDAQLLAVEVDGRRVERRRAPPRAGRSRRRARRGRGRAARAASTRGCGRAAAAISSGARTPRQVARALRRRDQVGRVLRHHAVLAQRRGTGRAGPRACAPIVAATARARRASRRSGAARAGHVGRVEAAGRGPAARTGRCRRRRPAASAPPRRGGAGRRRAARSASLPRERRLGRLSSAAVGLFFIDTRHGSASRPSASSRGGDRRRATAPPRPWLRIQGTGDASTMWYAVMRKQERGVFIGAPGTSPLRPPCPAAASAAGRRSRSRRSRAPEPAGRDAIAQTM